jgi:hypothetical protein
MAFLAEAVSFQAPASTDSSYSVSLSSGIWGSNAPKIIIPFSSGHQTLDSDGTHGRWVFGAAHGTGSTDEAAVGTYSRSALPTSDCERRNDNTKCIMPFDSSVTVDEAALVSLDTTPGFTLNYSKVNGAQLYNNCLALGGSDLTNVKLLQFNTKTGGSGTDDYTGFGFDPEAIILFSIAGTSTPPASHGQFRFTLGFCDGTTSAGMELHSQDGQPTSNTNSLLTTTLLNFHSVSSQATQDVATFDSFITDGFRLDYSAADATERIFWAIGFAGGQYKVVIDDSPTTDTTTDTDLGFAGSGGLLMTRCKTSSASWSAHNMVSVGAMDGTNSCSSTFTDEDAQGDTDTGRNITDTYALDMRDQNQGAIGRATGSWNGNNARLTWTQTDGTAREWAGIFFGDAAGGRTTKNTDMLHHGVNHGTSRMMNPGYAPSLG